MALYTNTQGLPDAFVNAVINDPYTSGGDISATKLIDAPQRRHLLKKHDHEIVVDVASRVYSLLGQIAHGVLERAETTARVEERLYAPVLGWQVSGQFDRMDLEQGLIQDWKLTSIYKADGDISWERQLNVLRYLAVKNGHQVDRLQVVAIFRDWSKAQSERKEGYPKFQIKVIEVPVWTMEEAERYITERVELHQRVEAGEVIGCSDEERWYTGTTYALMKDGGKRAKRVVPILADLGEIPEGHHVETRHGLSKRCAEGWCDAAPFCEQWKHLQSVEQKGEDTNDVDF